MSRGRQEIDDAEALPANALQHVAGGVPREVELAARLPNGHEQLRGVAAGLCDRVRPRTDGEFTDAVFFSDPPTGSEIRLAALEAIAKTTHLISGLSIVAKFPEQHGEDERREIAQRVRNLNNLLKVLT